MVYRYFFNDLADYSRHHRRKCFLCYVAARFQTGPHTHGKVTAFGSMFDSQGNQCSLNVLSKSISSALGSGWEGQPAHLAPPGVKIGPNMVQIV